MILGARKATPKHRRGTPLNQLPLSGSAVARMQEDRRREVIAALRVEAQAKFNAAWGL